MNEGEWDYVDCWNETLRQFQHELTEQEYLMWFKNINYDKSEESQLYLSVPSSFYKDQITRRYLKKLENKIFELLGNKVTINFTIKKISRHEDNNTSHKNHKTQVKKKNISFFFYIVGIF